MLQEAFDQIEPLLGFKNITIDQMNEDIKSLEKFLKWSILNEDFQYKIIDEQDKRFGLEWNNATRRIDCYFDHCHDAYNRPLIECPFDIRQEAYQYLPLFLKALEELIS